MPNRHPVEAGTKSDGDPSAALAGAESAMYARPPGDNGEVTDNGPGAGRRQDGNGNAREPTIRELQLGIQANRQRIIRLEETTRREFRRQRRELKRQRQELREQRQDLKSVQQLQNQMLGQMRAMVWIMGVIGGITVLTLLGGVLVPAITRLMAPLGAG